MSQASIALDSISLRTATTPARRDMPAATKVLVLKVASCFHVGSPSKKLDALWVKVGCSFRRLGCMEGSDKVESWSPAVDTQSIENMLQDEHLLKETSWAASHQRGAYDFTDESSHLGGTLG